MKLFDVVELTVDLPKVGLSAGAVGTIVDEYFDSAFEVEFNDKDGAIIALTSVQPNQLRPHISESEITDDKLNN